MATIFTVLGAVVSAVGTIAAGAAASRQANAQAAAQEHAAQVADQKAMQERAVAQHQSFEKRREARFAQSTLLARSAASGASASDPTVISLGENIAERSEYMALTDMYRGEQAGRDQESQAELNRWSAGILRDEADMAMTGGFLRAGSTVLSGASSAFGQYSGARSGGFVGAQPVAAVGPSIFGTGTQGGPLFPSNRDYWDRYYG